MPHSLEYRDSWKNTNTSSPNLNFLFCFIRAPYVRLEFLRDISKNNEERQHNFYKAPLLPLPSKLFVITPCYNILTHSRPSLSWLWRNFSTLQRHSPRTSKKYYGALMKNYRESTDRSAGGRTKETTLKWPNYDLKIAAGLNFQLFLFSPPLQLPPCPPPFHKPSKVEK